jgi:hypothetical protein
MNRATVDRHAREIASRFWSLFATQEVAVCPFEHSQVFARREHEHCQSLQGPGNGTIEIPASLVLSLGLVCCRGVMSTRLYRASESPDRLLVAWSGLPAGPGPAARVCRQTCAAAHVRCLTNLYFSETQKKRSR